MKQSPVTPRPPPPNEDVPMIRGFPSEHMDESEMSDLA
jgi:hypothetical protein